MKNHITSSATIWPAFDLLYQEHLRYVTRLARRFAPGDRDMAADLRQEAWLALLETPEERWSEPSYVRTVIFRAMARWRAREAAHHGLYVKRERRRTQHIHKRSRDEVLHLHTDRIHLSVETDQLPLRAAA